MNNGLFLIAREMFDHPVVGISNPKRFAAWCWIVSEARYKSSTIFVAGNTVKLERGQLSCSIRFMASRCGMSVKEARTFLEKLKKSEMIGIKTDTGQNLITICNYEIYQDFENYKAQQGHSKGTARAQTRTKGTKGTKETKDINGFHFEDFYKLYPLKKSRKPAKAIYTKIIKSGVKHEDLIKGLNSYLADIKTNKTELRFVKNPTTWLNQECWNDEYNSKPKRKRL